MALSWKSRAVPPWPIGTKGARRVICTHLSQETLVIGDSPSGDWKTPMRAEHAFPYRDMLVVPEVTRPADISGD